MTTGKSTKNILRNLLTLKSVAAINGTVVSSVTITKAPATSTLKASSTATAYVAAPSPTTPGTTPYCCTWYTVVANDSCTEIATDYGLTLEEFIALNTYVDTPCDGLWPNYSYCVSGIPLVSSTTSSVATTSATSITTTTPIQTGMASGCMVFYEANPGDGCYDITAAYGITLDEFYAWNPAVGACASLWPNYYYCVGM
jgi:LysM repeat protein